MAILILAAVDRCVVVNVADRTVLDDSVELLKMLCAGTIVTVMCSELTEDLRGAWRHVVPQERPLPPDSKRTLVEALRDLGWITTASIVESYPLEELRELADLADKMLNKRS